MPKKIAILGLGWLGLPLAKTLFEKGFDITGSTTSSQKLMSLLKSHFSVRIIKVAKNNLSGDWKSFVKDATALIINIPIGKKKSDIENYNSLIEQITQRCDPSLKVIFISSTSVYGNHNELVTEKSEPNPTRIAGDSLLSAEQTIINHFGENATIVRFAGLYGEDRHPGRFLKLDQPILNPEGKINLIHLNECTALISAIIEKNFFGEIFNGCADEHPTRFEFYTKAAFSLSIPRITFDPNEISKGKEVCNLKSKNLLGINYNNPEHFLVSK